MNRPRRPRTPCAGPLRAPRCEAGAALIVGLILLLVLTLLGVSGMNMATLELRMAGNEQSRQAAFQAAETGIDLALTQGDYSTTAGKTVDADMGTAHVHDTVTFVQTTPVPDKAFSLGVAGGGVQAYHFEVKAVGTVPGGATSTHTQRFYVVGPAGP